MKDLTKEFPLWTIASKHFTVIDVAKWYPDRRWSEVEPQMLEWLRALDHPSWFAWERPRGKMIFGDHDVATLFALRWS